jgi:hypothetical protein
MTPLLAPLEDEITQEQAAAATDGDLGALALSVSTHVKFIQSTLRKRWTLTGLKQNKQVWK